MGAVTMPNGGTLRARGHEIAKDGQIPVDGNLPRKDACLPDVFDLAAFKLGGRDAKDGNRIGVRFISRGRRHLAKNTPSLNTKPGAAGASIEAADAYDAVRAVGDPEDAGVIAARSKDANGVSRLGKIEDRQIVPLIAGLAPTGTESDVIHSPGNSDDACGITDHCGFAYTGESELARHFQQ